MRFRGKTVKRFYTQDFAALVAKKRLVSLFFADCQSADNDSFGVRVSGMENSSPELMDAKPVIVTEMLGEQVDPGRVIRGGSFRRMV